MRKRWFLFVVLLLPHWAVEAWAQQAQLGVEDGPHYVGEPILLRVTAQGFEEDPPPVCDTGSVPAGLSVELIAVRPNVSSVTQVINGRVRSYRSVVYVFHYRLTAEQPGSYRLAPFTVRQASRQAQTPAVGLQIKTIESDADMRVALVLPTEPVYVGQRVPVELQWWYAGDLGSVRNLVIRSELFDRFSFIDAEVGSDDTSLPIQTSSGTIRLKAQVKRQTLNGREFVVLTAGRQLVVDSPASVELPPVTASVEKVTRWSRDFFGGRQPSATVKIRAVGKPQVLRIKSLPLDRAPASFAGAVGHGFTIGVEADRTVLRVGDPIELTVSLQGDGNLEQAGPPRLSAQGVLDGRRFRPVIGEGAGVVIQNRKRFVITVRVLDEQATEIPPIPYSWFDPSSERFQTAVSQPIALRVLPGQVVTAEDVVAAVNGGDTEDSGLAPRTDSVRRPKTDTDTGSIKSFDLTGADLSIETDIDQLGLRQSQRFGGYQTHTIIYAGSIGLVMIGWWRRRSEAVDPEIGRRRKAIKRDIRRIQQAGRLSGQAAAGQIAEALRRLAPHARGERREDIDRLLAECDAVAFAPLAEASRLDASLHQRACTVAKAVFQEVS